MTVLHHPDIDLPRLGLILHFMQIYQATLECRSSRNNISNNVLFIGALC